MSNAYRVLTEQEFLSFRNSFANYHLSTQTIYKFHSAFGEFKVANFSLEKICFAVGLTYPNVTDSKNVLETEIDLAKFFLGRKK
jgi:hypothetical protein